VGTPKVVQTPAGPKVEFSVDYDFPNSYCQIDVQSNQTSSWWPLIYNGFHLTWLQILDAAGTNVLAESMAVFERGTWKPMIPSGCSYPQTYQVRVQTRCTGFGYPPLTQMQSVTVNAPFGAAGGSCSLSKDSCPFNPQNSGGTPTPGGPINIGSGDVSYSVPLFTIAQQPMSLPFVLSYHSERFGNPTLVSSSIGLGWTHPFAQTMRQIDAGGVYLYQISAAGREYYYTRQPDQTWKASLPGDLRSVVTKVGSQYQLKDLDGTITAFDVTTGRWLSTTDRWSNAITGTYTVDGLATITDSMGRQITLTYAAGQVSQIAFDGKAWRFVYTGNRLMQIFDPLHTGVIPGGTPWRTFAYQADGLGVMRLLTEVRDDGGFLLEGHTYDTRDRGQTSVSEAVNKDLVNIEYDSPFAGQTRVTHVIDATTNQVSVFTLSYVKGRFLPSLTNGTCASCGGSGGDNQSFTYDPDGYVLTRTDGNGHVTGYSYNTDGNRLTRTDAQGTPKARTTTYVYGYTPWPNFVTQMTEPSAAKAGSQKTTTWTWNTTGALETTLTTSIAGFLLSADANPTTYTNVATFDTRHRLLTTDGPRTDVTDTTSRVYYLDTDATVNLRGRVQQFTDQANLNTLYANYDVFGNALTTTDPNGVVSQRVTDARGRTTSSVSKAVTGNPAEASDYTTSTVFDTRDRPAEQMLPRGNKTRYRWEDGTNRLTDTIRVNLSNNEIERRHLTLNLIGGTTRQEDQLCITPAPTCAAWTTKRSEDFVFDSQNRLLRVEHPLPAGSKIVYSYDLDGQLKTIQDEDHASANTTNGYDELDRLTTILQKLGAGTITTTYGYDVHDNLNSVTDPNGNVTTYTYDDFGRMQKQTSPVTGITTYGYDPAGNLSNTSDANTAAATRTYDRANRILTASATRAAVTENLSWTYDSLVAGEFGKGRVKSTSDPLGTTTYQYERRGMSRNDARIIQGLTYQTSYAYDANGNQTRLTYPSGRIIDYTYDFADRQLSAVSGATVYVASATYLPFGPIETITYGNNTVKRMSYDLRYRPLTNNLEKGLTNPTYLMRNTYGFDPGQNLTTLTNVDATQFSRTFSYDDLDRVFTATTGTGLWQTGQYNYDNMGTITSFNNGSRVVSFTRAGSDPRLLSATDSTVNGGAARSVTYDAAGNETAVGSIVSSYSPRNYLQSEGSFAYQYDSRGVRLLTTQTVPVGSPTLSSITLNPISILGGATATATITLTGNAPAGGAVVSLASSNPAIATVPATVTVPAGGSSVTLSVSATTVVTDTNVSISAGYAGTAKAAALAIKSRGDANGDGSVTVSDVFYLINALFSAGPPPVGNGDANSDAIVSPGDIFYLINYFFSGGPPPGP